MRASRWPHSARDIPARPIPEADAFDAQYRHMLLMAPAIPCVANHLWEQKLDGYGTCCAHPWEHVPA